MDLAGRRVLLTGASGGIGKAIARALHVRGADLAVTARRADVLDELCEEFSGDRIHPLPADLADRAHVEKLAERAAEAEVLVANAALPASGRIESFSPAEIDRALEVNLRAPIQLARAMVEPRMRAGEGHLVFISSLAGKVANPGSALYSATKFGLRAFAASVREDLLASGVGVTTVFPGFIRDAGMFAEAGVDLPRGVGTRTPADVAAAVVRGIEEDKAELDVAPLGLRAGAFFGTVAPNIAAKVQRRVGAEGVSSAIAEGQRDKR